jgi:hypothetical protein
LVGNFRNARRPKETTFHDFDCVRRYLESLYVLLEVLIVKLALNRQGVELSRKTRFFDQFLK